MLCNPSIYKGVILLRDLNSQQNQALATKSTVVWQFPAPKSIDIMESAPLGHKPLNIHILYSSENLNL